MSQYFYRFFKTNDRRDQFISGSIRFVNIEEYKEIEDAQRRDEDEGEPKGKYQADRQVLKISPETGSLIESEYQFGDVNISGSSMNKFFVVCMSDKGANLQLLSEKFGKYIVRVNDIEKLLHLLNIARRKISWSVGKIMFTQVKYDRGNYLQMNEGDPHLPFEYYYAQKSENFASEVEWRLVLIGGLEAAGRREKFIEVGSLEKIVTKIDL